MRVFKDLGLLEYLGFGMPRILKVNPEEIKLEDGFSRDVRKIGHFGTGELELTIRNEKDFENAKHLIMKSYEAS